MENRYRIYRERDRVLEFKGLSIPFLLLLIFYWLSLVCLFWTLDRMGFPFSLVSTSLGLAAFRGAQKIRALSQRYGPWGWIHHGFRLRYPAALRAASMEVLFYTPAPRERI